MRWAVLLILGVGPLALGSVHPPAYVPLLVLACGAGLAAWLTTRLERSRGASVPGLPGARALACLHGVVVAQLVPLPPFLLATISPAALAHHVRAAQDAVGRWRPVTVSPEDTARALAFLGGMTAIYAAVFWLFRERRWRRRLAATVCATAATSALVGLVQAAYSPDRIYGLYRPGAFANLFGPYVSRNHFAGLMAMAFPIALAFAVEAIIALAQAWRARHVGWPVLFEAPGNRAFRLVGIPMLIAIAVFASQSRGGLMATVAGAIVFALLLQRRLTSLLLGVLFLAVPALTWAHLNGATRIFESGLYTSRGELWLDAARMFWRFPLLGTGMNAFGYAYRPYQRVWLWGWPSEVHNEYLQIVLELGIVGAIPAYLLLFKLFKGSLLSGRRGVLSAGISASIAASATNALVDFSWQVVANAATFVALAGLAMQPPAEGDEHVTERRQTGRPRRS